MWDENHETSQRITKRFVEESRHRPIRNCMLIFVHSWINRETDLWLRHTPHIKVPMGQKDSELSDTSSHEKKEA